MSSPERVDADAQYPPDLESQPWPRRSLWPGRRYDPEVYRRGAALARALLAARKGCYEDSDGAMIHGPTCQCEPPF